MKIYIKTLLVAFLLFTQYNFSQNGLIGDGFGNNDWSNTNCFNESSGSSRILTTTANGTGSRYFRLVTCWDNNWSQWGPSTNSNTQISYNTTFTSTENNTSGAFYLDANSSYNYIFKTAGGTTSPNGNFVVFEVQGTVRSVSSVSTSSVYSGHNQLISATLDGSLSTGQGVYLRYTNDSWSSSTVVEMSGSGTSYHANIPASVNTSGASISYYVFTSGNNLTINGSDADLYTINLNNNSGSNYSYSVSNTNYDFNVGSIDVGDVWDSQIDGSYAYLANFTGGISIVDISDKTNPTEVGSLATSKAYDIFYLNDYLYVADAAEGMKIIDVSDKTNPTLVSSIFSGTSTSLHYYGEINVIGNYAYIGAYKNFYIYDVSNVNSPTLVSTYSCASGCNDYVIDGNYVYLANSSYGLQILDVSDPTSPTLTDSYDNGYLNGVSKNGNYIYGSDNGDFLDIYDVSDVTNISLVSSINCSTDHDAYSMIGYGNSNDGTYVYMAAGYAGVQVFDVSDPNNPSLHAFIRTTSLAKETEMSGNYLYVSDRTAGLKIYDTNLIKTVSRWTNSGGDNVWGNSANWVNNTLPTSSDDVTILNNNSINVNQAGASGSAANLNIVSGGSLTINAGGKLFLNNDFSNAGTATLNSSSSNFGALLISASSKASGKITYNRWVNSVGADEWDLIGSPVDELSISSFASTNDSPLATGGGSGSDQYAIGYYNNSDDSWTNYTTSTIGSSGNFELGKGYQMATDSGATLAFTGLYSTSGHTQAVQDYSSSSGRIWNLVANPFPTYMYGNSNANSNNFISYNAIENNNLHDSYAAIYGYDADGSGYTIYNNTDDGIYIAPGQAFMIAADNSSAGVSVSFNENMRTLSGSDDFISGDNMDNTEVIIKLFNGDTEINNTKLFFEDNLSLGLDIGYDAGHFDQNATIMTRLNEDDQGHGMAINAMGLDAMESAVIPLVINQPAGQEFRINLHTATIPDPNVYLEDVEEGTFTNLYEGDFVYTPTSDLEGVGRFFIHMSSNTMSNEEVATSLLNAYKQIDASYITIEGLATQSSETKVSLYNILGREVLSTSLNNNIGTQTISTVGLATGIYVIELESGNDRLTKKLVIR